MSYPLTSKNENTVNLMTTTTTVQGSDKQLTIKHRPLTLQDLQRLPVPLRVQDGFLIIEKAPTGRQLRKPVKLPLERVQRLGEQGLAAYILQALVSNRPTLIPFVLDNESLIRMARHFLRYCSASLMSLYAYTNDISMYSHFLGHSPDVIINDVKAGGNIVDALRLQNHAGFLEQYMARLQDEGLSPGRVHGAIKHVRTFYRVNDANVKLERPISRRVTFKDRAPTPEELLRVLEIAGLRERIIVTLLALGGFREDTLSKLQYRHLRTDLEGGTTPVHVHIDVEITKGKYADYDTFLGTEASEYLKLYLDDRRKGSPDGRRPPEEFGDYSPIIRDETSRNPHPITTKQIRTIVHSLYLRAGLIKEPHGRMYELRTHSLRKYFKTQLVALGVPESHVDYMMGHVTDTYNDIQSLGVEKLQQTYASSGLAIRPKTRMSKIEQLKEMIRAMGENPEQILTREALTRPATTHLDSGAFQEQQSQVLTNTLRGLIQSTASGTNQLHGG